MTTSNFGIAIREDQREIKAFKSAFEKSIGNILTVDGKKYKVIYLKDSYESALADLSSLENIILSTKNVGFGVTNAAEIRESFKNLF